METVKHTIPYTHKEETENCVGLINSYHEGADWIVLQVRENGKPLQVHKVVAKGSVGLHSNVSPFNRINKVMETREAALKDADKFFAHNLSACANFVAKQERTELEGKI